MRESDMMSLNEFVDKYIQSSYFEVLTAKDWDIQVWNVDYMRKESDKPLPEDMGGFVKIYVNSLSEVPDEIKNGEVRCVNVNGNRDALIIYVEEK